VITDRDLDAQLAGAAGIRDADLPDLPEEFLTVLTTDEPASVLAARQLVADAYETRTAPRRRRPSRKTLVRTAVAVVAVAAAWTTAVLVVPHDADPGRDRTATPTAPATGSVEPPANGITLVSAEQVTFPLSLDPAPEGLTPTFSRFGGQAPFGETPVGYSADYRAADGDGFQLWVTSQNPRNLPDGPPDPRDRPDEYAVTETATVSVGGADGELVRGDYVARHCTSAPSTPQQPRPPREVCTTSFAYLLWQRPDGQWAWIWADDSYSTTAAVVGVAESLVDRPQPAGLQLGLAPEGWSVTSYENSGMTLASDADPDQVISLSILERWRGYRSVDVVLGEVRLTGPVQSVTVQGKPARVALGKGDPWPHDWWNVVAELPNGTLFLLQVSDTLTEEQALEIAEQVSYTP
jgi:hypothetical protein